MGPAPLLAASSIKLQTVARAYRRPSGKQFFLIESERAPPEKLAARREDERPLKLAEREAGALVFPGAHVNTSAKSAMMMC